jgi:hypothetical protein
MRLLWMQIVILACGTALALVLINAPRAYEAQCERPRDAIEARACDEVWQP